MFVLEGLEVLRISPIIIGHELTPKVKFFLEEKKEKMNLQE